MFESLSIRHQGPVCHLTIARADNPTNAINARLIDEFRRALDALGPETTVVVVEGGPEYFCFGADFGDFREDVGLDSAHRPGELYDVWHRLASGPFVSIAHVRGKVNAGGVGFVAACDIVIASEDAVFSLSEILFGLLPACVMPFLMRRIGYQRANYMTLSAKPVSARTALEWGLADAVATDTQALLRSHLIGCKRISRPALARYKRYMAQLAGAELDVKDAAVAANLETFTDPDNLRAIVRFVKEGTFPWEEA